MIDNYMNLYRATSSQVKCSIVVDRIGGLAHGRGIDLLKLICYIKLQ